MAEATDDLDAPRARSEGPSGIRRYALLERLGQGGVGVVYTAYDARLDRKVAIKVLQREESPQARARFQREAQALARLHHPNVVTVFDAGEINERPFLAMELVDGTSLREWLRARPRGWREIVAVMAQAGRGLAAAHRAGLIHRDVKPDNILVARDGSARIADFGLARSLADTELDGEDAPSPTPPSPLEQTVTRDGVAPGTPGYMAPERQLDARSDQYGFCVSLGRVLEGVKAPAFVQRVVARGQSRAPSLRYPSMDALLVDLGRDPARTWRRVGLAGGVIATCVAAVLVATRLSAPAAPCQERDAARELAGVWDPEVKQAVSAAFAATGRSHAADTFTRTAAALDARASAWLAMRTEACQATALRHEQSPTLLDLRMQCLDRRLTELRTLTGLFTHADGPLVDNAVAAVYRLDDLDPCADARGLLEATPPPDNAATREKVTALRDKVVRAETLSHAGKYREAEELAGVLIPEARALGYPPVLGEALLALGGIQMWNYEDEAAQTNLQEATVVLAGAKDDNRVARAWISLINVLGAGQSRLDEALALRPTAEAALARAGDDRPQRALRAILDRNLGSVLKMKGRYDEALAMQRNALALQLEVLDPNDPQIGNTRNSIGVVLMHQGKYDAALEQFEETLKFFVRVYGPEHPSVAGLLINVGNVQVRRGHYAEAQRALERALAIQEKTLGPDHPEVAATLGNLGLARLGLGNLDGTRHDFERALAICEQKLPADHLQLANSLRRAGQIRVIFGQPEEGRVAIERALAIYEKKLDPENEDIAVGLDALGGALEALGKLDEAGAAWAGALAIEERDQGGVNEDAAQTEDEVVELRLRQHSGAKNGDDTLALAERAVATRTQLFGAENPQTANALRVKGEVLLALGRTGEATVTLEHAVRILEPAGLPMDLARARFVLARALSLTSQPQLGDERARALAAQARDAFAAAGTPGTRDGQVVVTWLAAHPAR